MTKACCEKCGCSDVRLDVYNDFDDEPGNLFCDPCVLGEMDLGPSAVMPRRPEGYYHCAPGTFE